MSAFLVWRDTTYMLGDVTHYDKYLFAPWPLPKYQECDQLVLLRAQAHGWGHAATYVLKRWIG